MEAFSLAIMLLLAVLASSFLARATKLNLPLPLIQIAVGMVLALIPGFQAHFDPEVFFLLFLPPLLFLDGWRIPKNGLMRDASVILSLSVGLVAFSIVALAWFIKFILPGIPLAVAFALAAVLSPTDPVAFAAVAKKAPIPKRLTHILEGESLLNDASGLVFFKFAVATLLTGAFSLSGATANFAYLSAGGIAVGAIVAYGIVKTKGWVAQRYGEDPGVQILISLLIPFAAYQMAETIHASGILAAVTAGVVMGYTEFNGQALAITRIRRNVVWDVLQYTLNGFIFVLVGKQFMAILTSAEGSHIVDYDGMNLIQLCLYTLAITSALIVLRVIWVAISFHIGHLRKGVAGHREEDTPNWRMFAVMALAGVRGAVTLAGVMSLPFVTSAGGAFPYRDFCVFVAAGVILLSMVIATVALPLILKGVKANPQENTHRKRQEKARHSAALAAIKAIEQAQHSMAEGRNDADLYTEAAAHVMEIYRLRVNRMENLQPSDQSKQIEKIEKELIMIALKAERDEIYQLAKGKKIDEETHRRLIREIDLNEARYT